jgi:hypothetical protein
MVRPGEAPRRRRFTQPDQENLRRDDVTFVPEFSRSVRTYFRDGTGRGLLLYSVTLAAGIASIYLFFWKELDTGFAHLFGDGYDGVIEAVLISHWHHVLQLAQAWNQPAYFYPHPEVLGYNDGFFLYGMIGAIYRAAGFGIFQAQSLVHITVKAIGFASMTALLNRIQGRHWINALGGALFTLAINSSMQAGHGQLLAVAFAPLLALLMLGLTEAVMVRSPRAMLLNGIGFVALFNSLLLTAYYMTWFFGLFVIIFCELHVVFAWRRTRQFVHSLWNLKVYALILAAWFAITVVPFLSVYLPKAHETGGQTYENQLSYVLAPIDLLNFRGSLLWGWLGPLIDRAYPGLLRASEFRVGFTPDVLLVFAIAIVGIVALRPRSLAKGTGILAIATLLAVTLPIAIDHHSLWYFVQATVPGANGVRTVSRLYIFLAFPITLLIVLFAAHLGRQARGGMATAGLMLLLLCASQINQTPSAHLDVAHEMAILGGVGAPPAGCTAFVVTNPEGRMNSMSDRRYRQNVQAMLVADKLNIPTLNGFATFNPPDWVFAQTDGYPQRVADYVRRHQLTGICRYDLARKTWDTDISPGAATPAR